MSAKAKKVKIKKQVVVITGIVLSVMLIFGSAFFVFYGLLYPLKYKERILVSSAQFDLPPEVVASVINTESSFNKSAVSGGGAMGLMQILPATGEFIAESLGIENFDDSMLYQPDINIEFGCFYLRYLLNKFDDEKTAFAAYNAGEGIVKKWLSDKNFSPDGLTLTKIPYAETANFVKKVLNGINIYKTRF